MNKYVTRDVAGTLSFGVYNGESKNKLWIEYCIVVVILIGAMTAAVIMITIERQDNPENLLIFIGSLLACVIPISFVLFIVSLIFFRNEVIRKRIGIFIQDAITMEAYSKVIDKKMWLGITPLIKFQVCFQIEGVQYVRSSEMEKKTIFNLGKPKGYLSGFNGYVNKKIKILYSPKYDEVMILKEPKH